MWFKNLHFFDLEVFPFDHEEELESKLLEHGFSPCMPSLARSQGWINPIDGESESLHYTCEKFTLICLKIEKKVLPAQVIKNHLDEYIKKIQIRENRKVYKKEKESLKDDIYQTLLTKAFSTSQLIYGCFDEINKKLWIDTANRNVAEAFTTYLRESLGTLKIKLPEVKNSSTVLTQWLLDREVPHDIQVNDACLLQNPKQENSLVRISRQDLTTDPIQSFITQENFYVKEIDLSWLGHLSFLMNHDFTFKKIRFSDEVQSMAKDIYNEDKKQQFATDFIIMAKTLHDFIQRIFEIFKLDL